ncbi:MAG: radical SAM protein [Ruminococcus sp.]|nr:radical SAM protein [Ruminococcus sp.]
MICNLCPRKCNAKRNENTASGFCRCEDKMKVAKIAPHLWEEPCISSENGCGAVFFSGCTLKCVYCQNYEISHENNGRFISPQELSEKLRELEESGVHTIEFVSATQYVDKLIKTLDIYKPSVPLIYNSSGYESIETLKKLKGYIDVYLPDFKYSDDKLAKSLSKCDNYTKVTLNAIEEMLSQQPALSFDEDGIIQKGVIIRHLVLPSHTKNSIGVLKLIKENFADRVLVSLMGQYTPYGKALELDNLNRKITKREYNKVLDELIRLDLDGFAQELKSADESYIPKWDY